MIGQLVWEDPPPLRKPSGGRRRIRWRDALLPLLAQPGRWARLAEYEDRAVARSTVWRLTTGEFEIPDGRFQFVARDRRLYARYLGPEEVND